MAWGDSPGCRFDEAELCCKAERPVMVPVAENDGNGQWVKISAIHK